MAYITLNKKNFFYNLDIIAKRTKAKDKIAIVLKDNAYGHGLLEIASMAQEYGITKCVVQTSEEAQQIAEKFAYILVLADTQQIGYEHIYYTINRLDDIEKFQPDTKVHLKVDTGMHRNGITLDQLEESFQKIKKYHLHLEAVFTHHRDADSLNTSWFWQNQIFAQIKEEVKLLAVKYSFKNIKFHSANTASLFRTEFFQEDFARIGIGVYGCLEMQKPLMSATLKPVLSLYASKISSRKLNAGQSIGYGGIYTSNEDVIVSNYNIGYGDGFLRNLSNKFQTPQGEKLVGRISMDNASFISTEDEILIFNDARKIAKDAGTISYEVLTSLKSKIQRNIV